MVEIKDKIVDTWWIIKKFDNSVIHYGVTPVGRVTQSGLDEKEEFIDELIWANSLLGYGITATTSENIVLIGGSWVRP